jgi:hypothetical protein
MLARRLAALLPAMSLAEALEITCIPRVAGLTGGRTAVITPRPFRAPHHTISVVGVIGGGQLPLPGEGSLAYYGNLFWMSCRSSDAMYDRSCASRSRRVSCRDHLATVPAFGALATSAGLVVTPPGVHEIQPYPTNRRSATACSGDNIPVDTPAQPS